MNLPTTSFYPYDFQPCDKSNWLPGPWDDETDSASWLDNLTNYQCAMIRNSHFGHWCGYVRVPKSHPIHGLSYNQRALIPPHWMERKVDITEDINPIILLCAPINMDETTATLNLLFFCHGGLTYGGNSWLGFDCGHSGDLSPYKYCSRHKDTEYRSASYVRSNCERLAKQIKNYEIEMEG